MAQIIKKQLNAFWLFLGTPESWVALMIFVFIGETINGFTFTGSFWVAFCALMSYIARILKVLEK